MTSCVFLFALVVISLGLGQSFQFIQSSWPSIICSRTERINLQCPLPSPALALAEPKGSSVQALVMSCSFGSAGVVRLWFGMQWGQSSLLCARFSCMTCSFGLLSQKSNSVSHETGKNRFPLFIVHCSILREIGQPHPGSIKMEDYLQDRLRFVYPFAPLIWLLQSHMPTSFHSRP